MIVAISALVLVGVFFCGLYVVSFLQQQSQQKRLAKAEQTAIIIDKVTSEAAVQVLSFIGDIVELSKGHISPRYRLNDFSEIKKGFLENKLDFIEVNLPEMQLRVFKQGEAEKVFPIIKKGNPDSWGGTAAGLYRVESGFRSSYSISSEVYMPYALEFYGKYYIHGEPYYPGGVKLISNFSGGCLRLKDENAKELYQAAEIAMPVLVIDKLSDNYEYPKRVDAPFPAVTAQSYLVADLGSGFVFAEKNSTQGRPAASITKLMTAVVVAENIDLKKSITVKEWMLNGYGSSEGLEEGDRLRVVELFYPLLIESSNNAAEVISYFLGRDKTIKLMNEKAKSILMPSTTLTDPSGYDPGNISTAQDLFYLARYIKNNRPPIFNITRSEKVRSFGSIKFDPAELWNKNVFSEDDTFVGGKTGFIDESRYNGLFVFRFKTKDNKERDIAIILLGSKYKASLKSDTQKVYIWLAKNFFDYEKTLLQEGP